MISEIAGLEQSGVFYEPNRVLAAEKDIGAFGGHTARFLHANFLGCFCIEMIFVAVTSPIVVTTFLTRQPVKGRKRCERQFSRSRPY
jgi:hypothetical protein